MNQGRPNMSNMGRGGSMNNGMNANGGGGGQKQNNNGPLSLIGPNGQAAVLTVAELRPSMRGFNLECILLEQAAEPRRTFDNQLLTTFLVADKTGSVVLIVWGEEGRMLKGGDLVRIYNGEAKLFKGFIQLTTARWGKYKKIGEDTMIFSEKPNWSEFTWMYDPKQPNTMIPIAPQMQKNMQAQGLQPVGPGQTHPQRMGQNNFQPAINPGFRGEQRQGPRQFNQFSGPNQGMGGGSSGPAGGPGQQQQSQHPNANNSSNNNNNNNGNISNGNHLGSGSAAGGAGPMNGNGNMSNGGPSHGQHGQQYQQQRHGHQGHMNHQGGGNQGPGGNRHKPFGGHQHGGNNGSGPSNPGSGHPSLPPNPRFNNNGSNAKNRQHRDLDAPDSYPSPRTGLANSVDDFARDMRMVQGGSGVGPSMGGGGGGSKGPPHMRKRPKLENE